MRNNELVASEKVSSPSHEEKLRTVVPGVNIYEDGEEFLLQVEMPGVTKEAIAIDLDNGRLSLSARREGMPTGTPIFSEFGPVEFRRAFSVPQSINGDKVHAEFSDGVLNLHLPKSEAFKPRTIKVKEG